MKEFSSSISLNAFSDDLMIKILTIIGLAKTLLFLKIVIQTRIFP